MRANEKEGATLLSLESFENPQPISCHRLNFLTIWSQTCCVDFDKSLPSLGLTFPISTIRSQPVFQGDFETNKRVIWKPRRQQEEGWRGQQEDGEERE